MAGAPLRALTAWPYQAGKFEQLEGGLRIPMRIIAWPRRLPQGQRYGYPVMHMDLLPTALAAAGIAGPGREGVDLLPYMLGETKKRPHEQMFWSVEYAPTFMAARVGDWKLVRQKDYIEGLFNLAEDPEERNDLSRERPEKLAEVVAAYNAWSAQNPPALLTDAIRKDVNLQKKNVKQALPPAHYTHMFGPAFEKETSLK